MFEQFRMWLDIFADATVPIVGIVFVYYVRRFVNNTSITIKKKNKEVL
jgi:hypothetical protein